MKSIPIPAIAVFAACCMWSPGEEISKPDWQSLVDMGKRYDMPFPDASAKLALIHSETWSVVGNRSHPHDPANYYPGWIIEELADGSLRALIGFRRVTLKPREKREPLSREFSMQETPAKIGGHMAQFDEIGTFALSVQCAARGDKQRADLLWERFASEPYLSDGFGVMRYREGKANPRLLFAAMLFDNMELRIADPESDFATLSEKMAAMLNEFPALADERRRTLAERLAETAKARPPEAGSVEALLIAWGKSPPVPVVSDDHARDAIVLRGFEAIPELLRLQHDKRLTNQRYGAIMNSPSSPKPMGDLAREALAELLPDVDGRANTHYGPNRVDFDKAWEQAKKEGEQAYYLRQAWQKDQKGKLGFNESALFILGAKYPDKLAELVTKFEKEAKDDSSCWNLAEALATSALPPARKTELLLVLASKGDLGRRRAAIQVLAGIDHDAAIVPARALIKTLPKDTTGEYWTSDVAGANRVVLAVDDDEVWNSFLEKTRKASVGLRLEWMNAFDYSYVGDRLKTRRLAFLAAFLNDETLRDSGKNSEKYEGPCAAFTFPKITVRDFVAMQIASILRIDPLDSPDATWTEERWQGLRLTVEKRLKQEGIAPMT